MNLPLCPLFTRPDCRVNVPEYPLALELPDDRVNLPELPEEVVPD